MATYYGVDEVVWCLPIVVLLRSDNTFTNIIKDTFSGSFDSRLLCLNLLLGFLFLLVYSPIAITK